MDWQLGRPPPAGEAGDLLNLSRRGNGLASWRALGARKAGDLLNPSWDSKVLPSWGPPPAGGRSGCFGSLRIKLGLYTKA